MSSRDYQSCTKTTTTRENKDGSTTTTTTTKPCDRDDCPTKKEGNNTHY
ncbi:hypothetical protein PPL_03504 (plasmid) [Heterostelium pallidum]|uniref:Uncharacterized protein n=1 Tax=Heterostelium pallidum (strain ATCC 26659 / Pp 5 / PN500) TaxID=670386 RepID=D3EMR2_HETP5|nr:hypothetical protein PPL_03504 [Heterostelium pallidum]ADC31711.1 hypothetical protein PPL_03504 [Heterostelium pallidum]|eukprot:YP_003422575.1 hypothetical protein PPL_03504 (plasmid) [Heterostelium pallidum]